MMQSVKKVKNPLSSKKERGFSAAKVWRVKVKKVIPENSEYLGQ